MSREARPFGVNLAFEFLGFPWCSVRTAAQAWEIVTTVNNRTWEWSSTLAISTPAVPRSIRRAAIDARRLAVFHINDVEAMPKDAITDANRLFPGDGVIPLKDIIAAVRSTGFDGVASVEIFRPEYWARDPLSVAQEAKTNPRASLDCRPDASNDTANQFRGESECLA